VEVEPPANRRVVDPDQNARGFVGKLDPLRYVAPPVSFDPEEKNGLVSAMIPPGSRVLDVGCATGSTGKELQDTRGCEVVGVEPHAERAAAARQRGLNVVTGVLEDLDPQQIPPFDAVLFLDILEHLPDPSPILEVAKRFLKSGGFVIASVPNVAHWTVRLDIARGKFEYTTSGIMDATHLRWFTESTLRRMFTMAGYQMTDWRVSSGSWLPVYSNAYPWRWLGPKPRAWFIARCKRSFPRLFGCQHVIRATLPPSLEGLPGSGRSADSRSDR